VKKVTPFRIQVSYRQDWLRGFEEWVPLNPDFVRFLSDDSDYERKSRKCEKTDVLPKEGDSETWIIYCNQCTNRIWKYRYFCTYCEAPSNGFDYESYELCLECFQTNFRYHQHPRSSFAVIFFLLLFVDSNDSRRYRKRNRK
jgi:hypothetical protein